MKIKIHQAEIADFHRCSLSQVNKNIRTARDILNDGKNPYILENYCSALNIEIATFLRYFSCEERIKEILDCKNCLKKAKPCMRHYTAFHLLPYEKRANLIELKKEIIQTLKK